jgi:colicin import membrane protein
MRKTKIVMPLVVLGLAMAMGCAKPPQTAIDSAKQALQAAQDAGAADYAPASLRDAQNAVAAVDAEVQAQSKKFALMRSYKQTATLAATAQAAAEKAAADAAAGKEATKAAAEQLQAQAKTALDEATAALKDAPKGKGSEMDIQAMQNDLQAVATQISEAEAAHAAGRYLESKAKFEAALNQANNVKGMVEQAKAAKAAAKGMKK